MTVFARASVTLKVMSSSPFYSLFIAFTVC
jgi:hypothetical protein